jgi:hypothetical protein
MVKVQFSKKKLDFGQITMYSLSRTLYLTDLFVLKKCCFNKQNFMSVKKSKTYFHSFILSCSRFVTRAGPQPTHCTLEKTFIFSHSENKCVKKSLLTSFGRTHHATVVWRVALRFRGKIELGFLYGRNTRGFFDLIPWSDLDWTKRQRIS